MYIFYPSVDFCKSFDSPKINGMFNSFSSSIDSTSNMPLIPILRNIFF